MAVLNKEQENKEPIPPKFVKNVISLGHTSHAFSKFFAASPKSLCLYASLPAFLAASASFFAAASSWSSSVISTSSRSAAGAGFGVDVEAAGLEGGELGGEAMLALETPGGNSSEPSSREKPCMSTPMSTPRTSIIRGSCKALL